MTVSILTVTTPATDRTLLTIAELREAVGISDTSHDADLLILGDDIAARITDICKITTDGSIPGTLRQESLVETFRHGSGVVELVLSRRPIVSVTSVEEDEVALESTDYDIDKRAGILRRLYNDNLARWRSGEKIIVTYSAGWSTVPQALKMAAKGLAKYYWTVKTSRRDADLRSINIPGVLSKTYSTSSSATTNTTDVPIEVLSMLEPYKNAAVG